LIALNEAETKIEKITELVKLIQSKLNQVMKDAPQEVAEAYKVFIEETKNISTVQDLDYLFMKLKGTGSD
jgi:archaellum component FlaC